MIDRKYAIRYLVRQSQRTIYCAMGPKSFRAVKARKATSGAVKDTKSSGASGRFFQVVEVVQKQMIF